MITVSFFRRTVPGWGIRAACAAFLLVPVSCGAMASPSPLPSGSCVNVLGLTNETDSKEVVTTLKDISEAGVRTIRLPLRMGSEIGQREPYQVSEAYLTQVAGVAHAATARGLTVILDLHEIGRVNDGTPATRARFVSAWRQMARAWTDLPDNVLFELLNEPRAKIGPSNFRKLIDPAIAAIRESNPRRRIVVGGYWHSHYKALASMTLPNDHNLVPTFHYYDPMHFTHQGAKWLPKYRNAHGRWGSAADQAELARAVRQVKTYMGRSGRVPFIGEYGVIATAPKGTQGLYVAAVSNAFAKIGVPSCLWAWSSKRQMFSVNEGANFRSDIASALSPAQGPGSQDAAK